MCIKRKLHKIDRLKNLMIFCLLFFRIRFRYGNVWGEALGDHSSNPMFYVQLARDEVITKTVVMYGAWIDSMKITTSHREYPNCGGFNSHNITTTGSELRYIGSGYSAQAVGWGFGPNPSGLKVYFIC